MSLRELATTVEHDVGLLRDQARLIRDLQEYVGLGAEFAEITEVVRGIGRDAGVLRAGGIDPMLPAVPFEVRTSLRSLTANGLVIDAPAAASRSAMRSLRVWSTDGRRRVNEAYRVWFDAEFPDLEGTEAFAAQLSRLNLAEGPKIRSLVLGARTRRNEIPKSREDFEDVRSLAVKLKEAVEAFAPTEGVRSFVRALLGDGAPMTLYTTEVQSWAKERGLVRSFRIRLARDSSA